MYRDPFSNPEEREANRQATELLIPEQFLLQAFKEEPRISVLARRFGPRKRQ
jgi:Zn-dependent peptidase ImmA (M78 family)